MKTIDSYRFLIVTVFRKSQGEVSEGLRRILAEQRGWGRFEYTVQAAQISDIYEIEPPGGGSHFLPAMLYTPRCSIDSAVLFVNSVDGWFTMVNNLNKRLDGFCIQVATSRADDKYALNGFQVWHHGGSLRTVHVMRDPKWVFFQSGESMYFENESYYMQQNIRERLNREILIEYMLALGWDLRDERFWDSDRAADYFIQTGWD